jgi:pimeloyl-ACP methyl ester carboxylesterase
MPPPGGIVHFRTLPRRERMFRPMITAAALAVLIYAAVCAALFVFQRSLIYLPQPFPAEALSRAMRLPVEGGEVLVTVRAHSGPKALIYFGGNAEAVPYSLPELAEAFPDRALYLAHYRGYGGSSGSPSEAALFADALALYDTVRRTHQDIAVMGRSLGSAVATYLAGSRPVSRLVLVTPFAGMAEVAARHYPFFPVRLLLRDRFDSASYAPRVDAPTLMLVAGDDEVVPRESALRLHAAFRPGLADLRVIAGAGHNTISLDPEYAEALRPRP